MPNSISKKLRIVHGCLPYFVVAIFLASVVSGKQYISYLTGISLTLVALFLIVSACLNFESIAKSVLFAGVLIGTTSLYLSRFIDDISAVFFQHGGIIIVGESIILMGHVLLVSSFDSERMKGYIHFVTSCLVIAILLIGPLLFGLPVLYFLEKF